MCSLSRFVGVACVFGWRVMRLPHSLRWSNAVLSFFSFRRELGAGEPPGPFVLV
jgi:hypothetical protein